MKEIICGTKQKIHQIHQIGGSYRKKDTLITIDEQQTAEIKLT